MQVVDLTGNNRAVLGFHVDNNPDGTISGRFEVSMAGADIGAVGAVPNPDAATVHVLTVKFDKPASIGAFVQVLNQGNNRLGLALIQEQVRKEQMEKAQAKEDLAERILHTASILTRLQSDYDKLAD